MKTIFVSISILFMVSCTKTSKSFDQPKNERIMNNRFFSENEFNDNFSKEMGSSQDVYENMKKSGLVDYQLSKFDFDFVSDSKEKLDSLKSFLTNNYGYQMKESKYENNKWVLWGEAIEFPVDSENMLYWALNLYYQGYIYDAKLTGYGASLETPEFIDLDSSKAEYYFDKALDAYNKGDLGTAFIDWSTCIRITPNDPNSYYSRAIVRDELQTWKSALKDYDKAIELAPNFTSAIVNRGASRDESGDYAGAIEDYSKVIELEPSNSMAYLNRGNSNYNLGLNENACKDWQKSAELGDETAKQRLIDKCK